MKKVVDALKIQIKRQLENAKIFWHQSDVNLENDVEDLKEILQCIRRKTIILRPKVGSNDDAVRYHHTAELATFEESQKDVPKKRGRTCKTSSVNSEPKVRSDSSESVALNDSSGSTSSTRSRRAAAQAAEHKLARVQSLSQLKTKLRRPTDFDEKQTKTVSSPPAKCRRTRRNQSAGSSSPQIEDVNGRGEGEITQKMTDESKEKLGDKCLYTECLVSVEKMNTPTIQMYIQPTRRSSRSLDRAVRKSNDLFNDSASSHADLKTELVAREALNSNLSLKNNKKKSMLKKDLDSGISSTEEELQQILKSSLPVAHSSPILYEPFDGEFKGFDGQPKNKKVEKRAALLGDNTYIVESKTEETQIIMKKTAKSETEDNSSEDVELEEVNVIKSRTKVLRKRTTQAAGNVVEKENVSRNNETHIIKSGADDSPTSCPSSKVTKNVDPSVKKGDYNRKVSEKHVDSSSSPEVKLRSRTKTIRKAATNTETNGLNSEYLISDFKENSSSDKINNRHPPLSPAPAKGELVKKRVEDFEKMQNGTEEVEEEKAVGRVTRNAMKNKVTSSVSETLSSKQTQNIPLPKVQASANKLMLSSDRPRMTPLGANNRMTPVSDSALKAQANKWPNSSNRTNPVETNNVTMIHKQAAEEAEKKRKEEERLKRQAKEEGAKKKKEKTLKATAEEARRKREEKLQKVAATREAAEKEKERIAAKAEREKEEKMRQIAIEKEKQKEEQQLRKKQILQQKMLEHEERRKQEEAARLAKLKEQEEEHKRLLAMKERELELQKQQKTELRLAEAEKTKYQVGKLGKIAAVNNAKLKMQGMTPGEKTNGAQPSKNYEITPAREDRPLLQPKTENDYGIDDAHSEDSSDDESQPKKMIPAWAQSKNRERLLLVNKYIPKKLWDMFMECDPCPDINQMFAGNPIKRRIRTSSAVWRTPPKYSRVAS